MFFALDPTDDQKCQCIQVFTGIAHLVACQPMKAPLFGVPFQGDLVVKRRYAVLT